MPGKEFVAVVALKDRLLLDTCMREAIWLLWIVYLFVCLRCVVVRAKQSQAQEACGGFSLLFSCFLLETSPLAVFTARYYSNTLTLLL